MVLVRYFAGARAAAGTAEEKLSADTVNALIFAMLARHGDRLAVVLGSCTFLVDGLTSHDRNEPLAPGAVVDVLPPFAGG